MQEGYQNARMAGTSHMRFWELQMTLIGRQEHEGIPFVGTDASIGPYLLLTRTIVYRAIGSGASGVCVPRCFNPRQKDTTNSGAYSPQHRPLAVRMLSRW